MSEEEDNQSAMARSGPVQSGQQKYPLISRSDELVMFMLAILIATVYPDNYLIISPFLLWRFVFNKETVV